MTFRLRIDPTIHAHYGALPDDGRRDLAVCLLDAMADPLAHSAPYGVDDGIMRTIARGYVTAAILIDQPNKTIVVAQITYAG
ncbi:hypothetical protein ABZ746_25385 [Streptomyces sp. NPDC020096]